MTSQLKGAASSIAAATVDADAEIARLAKLPPIEYERERRAAAERLLALAEGRTTDNAVELRQTRAS